MRAHEAGCGVSCSGNQIEPAAVTLDSMKRCLFFYLDGDLSHLGVVRGPRLAEESWISLMGCVRLRSVDGKTGTVAGIGGPMCLKSFYSLEHKHPVLQVPCLLFGIYSHVSTNVRWLHDLLFP